MEIKLHFFLALCALLAAGCAGHKFKQETSYTKDEPPPPTVQAPSNPPPREAGDRPVWVLPVFSTGYVAGAANQTSDVYVGPHSVTSMVEPGHWASQEEAELQGKPYVSPSSNRIVYPDTQSSETLRRGSGEMDVAAPTRRPVNTASADSSPSPAPETMPKATPAPRSEPSSTPSPAPEEMPDLPSATPSPSSSRSNTGQFQIVSNTDSELVFRGGQVGEDYSVDLANGKKVQIAYLSQTEVKLTADQASRTVVIKGLDSPVKVRLKSQ
jgi:hypothetical protein